MNPLLSNPPEPVLGRLEESSSGKKVLCYTRGGREIRATFWNWHEIQAYVKRQQIIVYHDLLG